MPDVRRHERLQLSATTRRWRRLRLALLVAAVWA